MKIFRVTGLEFKTPELEQEFRLSGHIDPRLRAIECYLAFYCFTEFKKNWIITQIARTPQGQFNIYGEMKPSKHLVIPVQAIDHRSHHLAIEEILELKQAFFRYFSQITPDALFKHHKGTAMHVHVQV